jgi:hypothetical protein
MGNHPAAAGEPCVAVPNARQTMTVTAVAFHSELDTRVVGDDEWLLLADFKAKLTHDDGTEEWVIAPYGFLTDLASVPRLPVVYLLFGNRARRSAVIHDYLIRSGRSRDFADEVFFVAMGVKQGDDEGEFHRFGMFLGVRLGSLWASIKNVFSSRKDEPWRDA